MKSYHPFFLTLFIVTRRGFPSQAAIKLLQSATHGSRTTGPKIFSSVSFSFFPLRRLKLAPFRCTSNFCQSFTFYVLLSWDPAVFNEQLGFRLACPHLSGPPVAPFFFLQSLIRLFFLCSLPSLYMVSPVGSAPVLSLDDRFSGFTIRVSFRSGAFFFPRAKVRLFPPFCNLLPNSFPPPPRHLFWRPFLPISLFFCVDFVLHPIAPSSTTLRIGFCASLRGPAARPRCFRLFAFFPDRVPPEGHACPPGAPKPCRHLGLYSVLNGIFGPPLLLVPPS